MVKREGETGIYREREERSANSDAPIGKHERVTEEEEERGCVGRIR